VQTGLSPEHLTWRTVRYWHDNVSVRDYLSFATSTASLAQPLCLVLFIVLVATVIVGLLLQLMHDRRRRQVRHRRRLHQQRSTAVPGPLLRKLDSVHRQGLRGGAPGAYWTWALTLLTNCWCIAAYGFSIASSLRPCRRTPRACALQAERTETAEVRFT